MTQQQPMSKAVFAERIAALALVFERETSPELTDIYWKAVGSRYPAEEMERAFSRAMTECRFFPRPAELIEFIEGSKASRGEVAFGMMIHAMQRVGSAPSVRFLDPVIHAVVSTLGGWPAVCQWAIAETPFRRKEFLTLYERYAGEKNLPTYLLGAEEHHNRVAYSALVSPPVLVGPGKAAGQFQITKPTQTPAKRLGEPERGGAQDERCRVCSVKT